MRSMFDPTQSKGGRGGIIIVNLFAARYGIIAAAQARDLTITVAFDGRLDQA